MIRRVGALWLAACSPSSEPTPSVPEAPRDAAVVDAYDEPAPTRIARKQRPFKEPRAIEITLRSTPSNATASVNGEVIGETPVTWFGQTYGVDVEFVFVMKNHASAKYRFVPVQSGVVHATLVPVTPDPDSDGGMLVPAEPRIPEPEPPLAPPEVNGSAAGSAARPPLGPQP